MRVSKRIKEICDYIPIASSVADVGCDHGYLILEAFFTKDIMFAQLIDNKKAPLKKAGDNLKDIKLNIEYTLSDGLDDLNPNVDTIVLAGMGGLLIKDILERNLEKIESKLIIIQANSNLEKLREFLYQNNLFPIFEKIILDRSHYYQIMALKKSDLKLEHKLEDVFLGKILKDSKSIEFKKHCESELKKLIFIKNKLDSGLEKTTIMEKIELLNKVLNNF